MTLNKGKFKAWLKENPNRVFQKKPTDLWLRTCPLATYLRETTNKDCYIGVGSYHIGAYDYGSCLPVWASSFVQKVDLLRAKDEKVFGRGLIKFLD